MSFTDFKDIFTNSLSKAQVQFTSARGTESGNPSSFTEKHNQRMKHNQRVIYKKKNNLIRRLIKILDLQNLKSTKI